MTTPPKHILVTGGAGYIGSHTTIALLEAGYDITIIDNFDNSDPSVIGRIEEVAGRAAHLVEGDITDIPFINKVMSENNFYAVMHFAGLKSVAESVAKPELYHAVNVQGTKNLLNAMTENDVNAIVFSSSATVYGKNGTSPISETTPRSPVNPYGETKSKCEDLIENFVLSDQKRSAAILRYFNPVGSHKSALIGETPMGVPANLMPLMLEAATGRRDKLYIWGNDYDTPDGTGVRDYIHVSDLAEGHVSALDHLENDSGAHVFNLGTGSGYSVLEMLTTFKTETGVAIPYEFSERRAGDIGKVVANPDKAFKVLGWKAKLNLNDMCRDAWAWQQALSTVNNQ